TWHLPSFTTPFSSDALHHTNIYTLSLHDALPIYQVLKTLGDQNPVYVAWNARLGLFEIVVRQRAANHQLNRRSRLVCVGGNFNRHRQQFFYTKRALSARGCGSRPLPTWVSIWDRGGRKESRSPGRSAPQAGRGRAR